MACLEEQILVYGFRTSQLIITRNFFFFCAQPVEISHTILYIQVCLLTVARITARILEIPRVIAIDTMIRPKISKVVQPSELRHNYDEDCPFCVNFTFLQPQEVYFYRKLCLTANLKIITNENECLLISLLNLQGAQQVTNVYHPLNICFLATLQSSKSTSSTGINGILYYKK